MNIKEMIAYSEGGIMSKQLMTLPNVTLFSMAAGTEISEHTTTKQGFVYVIEGDGVFNLAGKDVEMKEGVFISLQKNIIHSLKAVGNTSFLLSLCD
jgi:quercetin dioxygenase-like cupin family protein